MHQGVNTVSTIMNKRTFIIIDSRVALDNLIFGNQTKLVSIYPPLGVEVQPPDASESQVNTTCARHTKRNYKTRHIRHEPQDISHKT
jgi:hypothetical protein